MTVAEAKAYWAAMEAMTDDAVVAQFEKILKSRKKTGVTILKVEDGAEGLKRKWKVEVKANGMLVVQATNTHASILNFLTMI